MRDKIHQILRKHEQKIEETIKSQDHMTEYRQQIFD